MNACELEINVADARLLWTLRLIDYLF